MIRPVAAATAVLVLLAACAVTEAPDQTDPALPAPPIGFTKVDADGDGEIVAEEWEAYGNAVFVAIDTNGNNVVSVREMDRAFDVFDINGDGFLSRDEADVAMLDRNGDGQIERREWNGHLFLHGLEAGRNHRLSAKEMRVRRFETFTALDRNGTGRISRLELDDGAPAFTLFRF